jgi:hypothetical protein
MTNTEKELFSAVPANEFNTYWIPCTWFIYRLKEAAKRNKLLNPYALETIMREFCEFRAKCGLLWCYDWVSIPMVYTQVSWVFRFLLYSKLTKVLKLFISLLHSDHPNTRLVWYS